MRDLLYMVAVAGLGLSGIASAVRLIEWLIHTDPRLIAQTGRWAAAGLAVLSVPLLLALLINEKWMAAMALAAIMLFAFACYGPRLLQRVMRHQFTADWRSAPTGNLTPAFGTSIDEPQVVRRAIAVLEEYLRRTAALPDQDARNGRAIGMQHSDSGGASGNGKVRDCSSGLLSEVEALAILGLGEHASQAEIEQAHRRLRDLVCPEHGGTHYLTLKIEQAASLLLGRAEQASQPARGVSAGNVRAVR